MPISSGARGGIAATILLGLPLITFLWGRPTPLPPADFSFVLPKENATIDPALATSISDGWIVLALFEGLTRLDPRTLEPEPAAAEGWTVSNDGRTYTFRIRADAKWSDGAPVTAHDFLYAWRRLLDPRTGAANAFLLWVIEGGETFSRGDPGAALGISAPDPRTFVVRVREACPYLPSLAAHFSTMPLRRDLIERHGDRWAALEEVVSNGAYRVELRRVRDRIRLVKNVAYWRADDVAFEVIDARTVESSATALNLYLTGAVDWVNGIPAAAVPHLLGREDLHLGTALATNFLRFNVTRPPFADVRVRRAIDRALDRAALCRYVLRRGDAPARSLVPPSLPGYTPAEAAPEDAAAGRALLMEAGFPGGRGFPEIELLHAADESARALAEAIAARLAEALSIRVRPSPQEFKVFLDSQRSLRYEVCLTNWFGDYLDPTTFLDCFQTGASANRTGWSSAAYDELLAAAATLTTPGARAERLREAEALLLAEGPIALITYRGQPNLIAPDVVGFSSNLLDLHPLDRLRRR